MIHQFQSLQMFNARAVAVPVQGLCTCDELNANCDKYLSTVAVPVQGLCTCDERGADGKWAL